MNPNRPILAVIALLAAFAAGTAAAGPPSAIPAVKAEASVASNLVRLGDLIENAGPAATIPVFHAPELGATGTIQTYRVIEAARENGIVVLDTRGLNEVVVVRASRTVSLAEMERAVAESASLQRGLGDALDISVGFDRDVRPLLIDPAVKEAPRVVGFNLDARTRRFEAFIDVAGSSALRKNPVRVTGTLTETAETVTLARALARGEVVRQGDVVAERKPRGEVASDAIVRPELIIGQAARRALRAGQTVRAGDLMKPDLVARNDTVTIVFETPGIVLTARGKALASGAEGELVPVLNPQSKRVVQATVEGPGRVVVGRIEAASEATVAVR